MRRRGTATILAAAAALLFVLTVGAQTTGKRDAGGFPAPTPELERGRTVYVVSSCHFCHGIDLTGAAMGAADLLHLPLVGMDEGGNVIGPIVRAGLPNLQTAMPQYSDYTDQQIADLAAYVHYLRQQGRYRELSVAKEGAKGNAAEGKNYFDGAGKCGSCHSAGQGLRGVSAKYDDAGLRRRLLRPGPDNAVAGASSSAGLNAHLKLLENYADADVENLIAYLKGLK